MRLLDFYTTEILTSTTVLIECISWLIKVTKREVVEAVARNLYERKQFV